VSGFSSTTNSEVTLTPETRHLLLHLVFRRFDQQLHQLAESGVGAFVDFFHFHRADRMLNHQHRVIRRSKCFFLRFRQRIKSIGDQRYGEPAALLQFD
jgi:hypothetical protein